MKKRILSLLLCAALLLTLAPMALAEKATAPAKTPAPPEEPVSENAVMTAAEAFARTNGHTAEEPLLGTADGSGECGDNVTWTLDDEGTLTLSGEGETWNYNWGASPWFDDGSIRAVVVEDGVTSLGDCLFAAMHALQSVTLAGSVSEIRGGTFSCCGSLEEITIPGGVTYIGEWAFECCENLQSINIPAGVTWIGTGAFEHCGSLTEITIPAGVTELCNRTFHGCYSLQRIDLPDGLTGIGFSAFEDCGSLAEMEIPATVSYIGDWAFAYCNSLQSVAIPYGMTVIGNNVFYHCSELTEVTIPDTVRAICNWAFSNCRSLREIEIPDSVTGIYNCAFAYCTALEHLDIPAGVTWISEYLCYGCGNLQSVTIPDSVESIGNEAFACCHSLEQIVIPDSVTWIDNYAFSTCDSLRDVTLSDNLIELSEGVFCGCGSLEQIALPERLEVIGTDAFAYCWNLRQVELPETLLWIDPGAFEGCDNLETVWEDGAGYLGSAENPYYALLWAESPTFNGTIHEDTRIIAGAAFYGRDMTSVYIPAGVKNIGLEAFSECYNLEAIEVAEDNEVLEAIDGVLFRHTDKTGLIRYPIGKSGEYAIPDGVNVIADFAFALCSGLTSVSIPESVCWIGGGAFGGCENLTDVWYAGTEEQWNEISIDWGNDALWNAEIHFNDAVTVSLIGGKARVGTEITIPVELTNNEGLAGLTLALGYDDALTLTGIATGDALTGLTFTQPGDLSANPVTLFWDGMDEDASNGTVLYLTFTVNEGTEDGDYGVWLTVDEAYDDNLDAVFVNTFGSAVTVISYVPGDANGDGVVSGKDVTVMRRFIAGGYGVTLNELAADVSHDDIVSGKDVTILRRYIAGGYGITLE